MHSITVLMSTYNGDKYIREQIDSLLAQKGVSLSLLIRDDGSSDDTINIIEDYKKKYDSITLIKGDNLGPAWSFIELVNKAPESEYYAFCDQDDVWMSEKLSKAITLMEKRDASHPVMYYSNLMITDESLHEIRKFHDYRYVKENKYNAIVENMAAGCTMVFNKNVRDYVRRISHENTKYIYMHDAWIHLICVFFGEVIYDKNSYIYYRQHGMNVVGTSENKTTFKIISEKISRFFNKTIEPRRKLAESFYYTYSDLLDKADADCLVKIIDYKKNLRSRLALLFDKKICGPSMKSDLRYRLLVLRGLA